MAAAAGDRGRGQPNNSWWVMRGPWRLMDYCGGVDGNRLGHSSRYQASLKDLDTTLSTIIISEVIDCVCDKFMNF